MITLTNGVQVPENAVQLRTTAAIDGYYVTQPLRLVQYDETLPVAAVQLTYQSQPYIPPTGAELNVRMNKPDGKGIYNPCLGVDSSGIVYFVFTQQMTAAAGDGKLTVEVTDSGVKNSAPIIVNVAQNPVQEGQIESADEFLTLQEILAEAEKWGQIVQANAANIQEVIDNLPAIEAAPEAAQQAAASAAAAQQAAQEALGFRTFFSAVRPDTNGNLDPSRPMTVGPAASVEIESAGDRIQSVTALGFTQQAGSGDPSPTNVRALTSGGLKLVKLVLTGAESWQQNTGSTNTGYLYLKVSISSGSNTYAISTIARYKYAYSGDGVFIEGYYLSFGAALGKQYTVDTWKAMLSARYAAGDPVIVWYQPADESQATGLYAPIIMTGSEYCATCLPLTAPLCEGDSVVSWAKSGCDKTLVLDGTQSFTLSGTVPHQFQCSNIVPNTVDFTALSDKYFKYSGTAWNNAPDGSVFNSAGYICVTDSRYDTAEEFKSALAQNPVKVFLTSTNYTHAADISVSLETHVRAVLALDGSPDEVYKTGNDESFTYPLFSSNVGQFVTDAKCNVFNAYTADTLVSTPDLIGVAASSLNGLIFRWGSGVTTVKQLRQALQATNLTVVYPLSTPITYAHPAVVLEAATGEQLTYTITGQSGGTVSVALKPFQDGGHAKTADNAQQLGGLSLSALQNLLVPVGYIFSWAPTSGGPDLSTAQKVAAYFGFGTWAAYGTGQVLVGVDSGQTEFATVGKTGGEKAHSLTTQELPSFTPSPSGGGNWLCIGGTVAEITQGLAQPGSAWVDANIGTVGGQTIGGNQPHNNLQPYITVYRWRRVA